MRTTLVRSTIVLTAAVALAAAAPPTILLAQTPAGSATIEGRVTEEASGRPLESVQIVVVGTTLGAATNATGEFRITGAPARALVLRTRYIGFAPQTRPVTVTAGQTARVTFALRASALQLDQVVVTGTGGAVETKKLGNTIAIITPPPTAPVTTLSETLQGREPGLVGLPSSGMTGEGARIRIRGNASISQSNEPIILVDGIRINQAGGFGNNISRGGGSPSRLDDIDPSSIERIEVLKGAAAATLYGTEASNGVIQIFTKKGATGRPVWSFGFEQSASQFPKNRFPANAGFARTQGRADSLSVFYGRTIAPFEVIERRVLDELVTTGYGQVYNGQVAGGTGTTRYFVSGRFANEDGPLTGTLQGFDLPAEDVARRAQATANIDFQPRTNLRFSARSSYTGSFQETPSNSNDIYGFVSQGYLAKPENANCVRTVQLDPTKAATQGVRSPGECDGPGNPFGNGAFATIREGAQLRTRQDVQRFIGAFETQLQLPDNLTLTAITGVDITGQRSSSQRPFGNAVDNQIAAAPNGARTIDELNDRQITVDGRARWGRQLRSSLAMTLDLGVQGFFSRTLNSAISADNFPGPGLEVVTAGTVLTYPETFLSTVNGGVFGQAQFEFADWIFTTVGGRYDYASAFGESAPGVFYPKISLSVVPSDREWYRSSGIANVVPTLRLRGAVGRSGRQPGAFDQFTTFGPIAIANPTTANGLIPINLGNPDLAPEVSTETELGFEAGLFGDRLGLSATGWNRVVSDLLVPVQYAPSGGFLPSQLTNVGQMKAHGLEFQVTATALSRPNLQIDLFANSAYLAEDHRPGRRRADQGDRRRRALPQLPARGVRPGLALRRHDHQVVRAAAEWGEVRVPRGRPGTLRLQPRRPSRLPRGGAGVPGGRPAARDERRRPRAQPDPDRRDRGRERRPARHLSGQALPRLVRRLRRVGDVLEELAREHPLRVPRRGLHGHQPHHRVPERARRRPQLARDDRGGRAAAEPGDHGRAAAHGRADVGERPQGTLALRRPQPELQRRLPPLAGARAHVQRVLGARVAHRRLRHRDHLRGAQPRVVHEVPGRRPRDQPGRPRRQHRCRRDGEPELRGGGRRVRPAAPAPLLPRRPPRVLA